MSEYNREQAISWIYGKIGRGFHGDLKPTILEEAKRKFDLDGEEVVKIKRYFDEEYGWKLSSLRDRIALAAVRRELGRVGLADDGQFSPGDDVHLGFGSKGGAGYYGKLLKIEDGVAYIRNAEGREFKGPAKFLSEGR